MWVSIPQSIQSELFWCAQSGSTCCEKYRKINNNINIYFFVHIYWDSSIHSHKDSYDFIYNICWIYKKVKSFRICQRKRFTKFRCLLNISTTHNIERFYGRIPLPLHPLAGVICSCRGCFDLKLVGVHVWKRLALQQTATLLYIIVIEDN